MKNMKKNNCNSGEHFESFARRDFLSVMALAGASGSLLGGAGSLSAARRDEDGPDPAGMPGFGKAKHVIYLMLSGGFSHMDSFDPRPDLPEKARGQTRAIDTNVDGIRIANWFPKLAGHMDKIAICNSRKSRIGAHAKGQYYVRTAYELRGADKHPHLGSWLSYCDKTGKKSESALPANFIINPPSNHPNAGWMHPKHAPLPIGSAQEGLKNSKPHYGVDSARLLKRVNLSKVLGESFRGRFLNDEVQTVSPLYDDALAMMKGKDLVAFDLKKEPEWKREAYGENNVGQGLLLAKRLVERGVRHVEVNSGGWDNHNAIYEDRNFPKKSKEVDDALSALLEDLQKSGLLDETLVVLTTEFGRTPVISENLGRNHWPQAFSCLLAGAGVKAGTIFGAKNDAGGEVAENEVSTPDWCATIAHLAGLPWNETFFSPSGRPFKSGGKKGQAQFGLIA